MFVVIAAAADRVAAAAHAAHADARARRAQEPRDRGGSPLDPQSERGDRRQDYAGQRPPATRGKRVGRVVRKAHDQVQHKTGDERVRRALAHVRGDRRPREVVKQQHGGESDRKRAHAEVRVAREGGKVADGAEHGQPVRVVAQRVARVAKRGEQRRQEEGKEERLGLQSARLNGDLLDEYILDVWNGERVRMASLIVEVRGRAKRTHTPGRNKWPRKTAGDARKTRRQAIRAQRMQAPIAT